MIDDSDPFPRETHGFPTSFPMFPGSAPPKLIAKHSEELEMLELDLWIWGKKHLVMVTFRQQQPDNMDRWLMVEYGEI